MEVKFYTIEIFRPMIETNYQFISKSLEEAINFLNDNKLTVENELLDLKEYTLNLDSEEDVKFSEQLLYSVGTESRHIYRYTPKHLEV